MNRTFFTFINHKDIIVTHLLESLKPVPTKKFPKTLSCFLAYIRFPSQSNSNNVSPKISMKFKL